jgi:RimJ/RimL family protein N-acetyltransferase
VLLSGPHTYKYLWLLAHKLVLNSYNIPPFTNFGHLATPPTQENQLSKMAANIFRSKRLVYRAIDDNEKDKAFIHSLRSDTLGTYNYMNRLPIPLTRESSDSFTKYKRTEEFLSVLACIPVVSEAADAGGTTAESDTLVPIGLVTLFKIPQTHMQHRKTDLGIYIASKYQGQGYGSESIEWILGYGFQIAGLHRVGISAFSYNARAVELYKRLGFVLEGARREAVWFKGGWHDEVQLGMLESEWRARMELKKLESEGDSISVDGWSETDVDVCEKKQ